MIVLLPILGVLDKPIFLAARSEHYWVMMMCFAFAGDWIAGCMAVQLALWFFAGVSKPWMIMSDAKRERPCTAAERASRRLR